MFHLLSSMRTSPHMYSGTRSRSGTVGNGSYWQSAGFFTVGMISFSGSFGVLCGLEHWQIIAAELLMMFPVSAGLKYFRKEEDAKRNHERIYTDH